MTNARQAKDLEAEDLFPKISIPLTDMVPAPHRAFVKVFNVEEIKLKSGLVVPGMSQGKDYNKNNLTIEKKRYFLAAIGADFNVFDSEKKGLEIGDEVFMIDYDDKTILHLPKIFDFHNSMECYEIIDDLAVVGFRRSPKPENKEIESKH